VDRKRESERKEVWGVGCAGRGEESEVDKI